MRKLPLHAQLRSGFTIVELLIVIVVIGILASIIIVAFNGVQARAHFATSKQDMSTIKKALESYYAINERYPDSSNCVNTSSEYNYQSNWCGWDQGQGDSFIPGLVPEYIAALPQLDRSLPQTDSYLYQSGKADGTGEGGTVQYQLIRYRAPALGGLSAAERSPDNPNRVIDVPNGYSGAEAWGFKSDPTNRWW